MTIDTAATREWLAKLAASLRPLKPAAERKPVAPKE